MKKYFFFSLLAILAGCSSDASTSQDAASKTAGSQAPAAGIAAEPNPDPRVALIQEQHKQLLDLQRKYSEQVVQLTGYEQLTPQRIAESENSYVNFLKRSEENLAAVSMLNAAKAQDPAQIALVGDIAARQARILKLAQKQLDGIHDEHYLPGAGLKQGGKMF